MARWPEYVPVAMRKLRAKKLQVQLQKEGRNMHPVEITGRKIANTFWGVGWCDHLAKFSDYSNRLPRGRSYARNGSVCDLTISKGKIDAMVSGSDIYSITIHIDPLPEDKWRNIKEACSGGIGSVLELLQGKLSTSVMLAVTDQNDGLFPDPSEIRLDCDCPDWANLCKHLAAVLYGVGARLDQSPELLFLLRGVDHNELIDSGSILSVADTDSVQVQGDLADIFSIDLDETPAIIGSDKNAAQGKTGKPLNAKSRAKKAPTKVKTKSKSKVAGKNKVAKQNKSATTPGKKQTRSKTAGSARSGTYNKVAPKAAVINVSRGIRASHLKQFRKQNRLSVAQLARITGKSVPTINKWESTAGVLNLQASSKTALERIFLMTGWQLDDRLNN